MIARIEQGANNYPTILRERLGDEAPSCLYAMGEAAILRRRLLGLVCSVQCPGSIVIKTLDAIRMLRDAGVTMVGGFHSPMEKECLDILLRGNQPVILCPAKGLVGLRIGQMPRQAVKEGHLLIVSRFAANIRRTTAVRAMQRNDLVAALADALWVPHAAPGGKTWETVRVSLERQQPVFTFAGDENAELLEAGSLSFDELDATTLSGNRHSGKKDEGEKMVRGTKIETVCR